MNSVADVLSALESIAPARWAFSYDKVGLQVGDPSSKVLRAVVALDRSQAAVHFALKEDAQLLLTHHPLLFQPLAVVTPGDHVGKTVMELVKHGIAHVAAHTNWDSAPGGINDVLAELLHLTEVTPFGEAAKVKRHKIVFTVPEAQSGPCVDACSEAGAGVIGAYRRCSFSVGGVGTFEPVEGAQPAIGAVGRQEEVNEARVEMTAPADRVSAVLRALRRVHPYETPAIDVYELTAEPEMPAGRIGVLRAPVSLREFATQVDQQLESRSLVWGDPGKLIRKVALTGGAADSEWRAARNAGADVFVTGEVKQHVALEAMESGIPIIAAGHFATENPGCRKLRTRMEDLLPEIDWIFFDPDPGFAGRPL